MVITYYWKLVSGYQNDIVEKYCHNCGRKVLFHDSNKRRRNANGKDIFEYAIYKCEKGHTWNVLLRQYKAADGIETDEKTMYLAQSSSFNNLNLHALISKGILQVDIVLAEVIGKWRLDKVMAMTNPSYSRSRICKLIKCSRILIDGHAVKPGYHLKRLQRITIFLHD